MFSYVPTETRDAGSAAADDGRAEEWSGPDGLDNLLEAVAEVVRARARAAGLSASEAEASVSRQDVVRIIVDRMLSALTPGEEVALRAQFGLPAVSELEDVPVPDPVGGAPAWEAGLVKLRALVA